MSYEKLNNLFYIIFIFYGLSPKQANSNETTSAFNTYYFTTNNATNETTLSPQFNTTTSLSSTTNTNEKTTISIETIKKSMIIVSIVFGSMLLISFSTMFLTMIYRRTNPTKFPSFNFVIFDRISRSFYKHGSDIHTAEFISISDEANLIGQRNFNTHLFSPTSTLYNNAMSHLRLPRNFHLPKTSITHALTSAPIWLKDKVFYYSRHRSKSDVTSLVVIRDSRESGLSSNRNTEAETNFYEV